MELSYLTCDYLDRSFQGHVGLNGLIPWKRCRLGPRIALTVDSKPLKALGGRAIQCGPHVQEKIDHNFALSRARESILGSYESSQEGLSNGVHCACTDSTAHAQEKIDHNFALSWARETILGSYESSW